MLINRFKYISLALAVLIASASIAYADDNDHIKLLGDVNGDKSVNISDAISVISHIKGNTPAGFNVTASDVNVDETVNISDFIGIINLIKNKGVAGGSASSLIFTESSMSKTYGQDAFFNDVYRAGSTDDITFVSSNANVISVNATTGEMTVVGPGTATITATLPAFGSFSEAVASVTVTVAAANTSAINVNDDITFDATSYSYTGADVEPVVTVVLNGKDVTDQFNVTYEDNTNAGTAKVILTPKSTGGFAGSAPIEKEFTIEKANPTVSTAPATVSGDLSYTGSSQPLATAGSVSNGTVMYYVNTSGTAPTSTSAEGWSSTIPTGEDAGTYHVWYYVKGDTNYNDSDIQSLGSKTISKAAATTDPVTTMNTEVTAKKNGDDNQTYTGGDITLVNAGESNAGTLKYKVTTTNEQPAKNSGGWSTDLPTAEDAGTYFVWYYAEGNDNYEETAVSATPIEVTIDKANPTVSTAPATVSGDLSYTGSSQPLATAGSVSNGTVMYYVNISGTAPTSTSAEGWTSTIPTGEDAGTYHVWYYVKGDTNYNDSDIQSLGSKTISKVAATTDPVTTMNTEVTAKKNGDDNQTYTGGDITLVNAGESNAGTLKYKVTTTNEQPAKNSGGWSTDLPTAEDAGTYFVWYYAEGNDNYEETAVSATPIEVTIDKANPTVSTAPTTVSGDLSYTGSSQPLATSGSVSNGTVMYYVNTSGTAPTSTSVEGWTSTIPTGEDAGTYHVWYYVKGDTNYNDSDIQSLGSKTISKAAATTDPVTTMNTEVTAKKNGDDNQSYTGGDITLVNAGESNAGTLKYKVTTTNEPPAKTDGGWSTDLPTAEDAGTYFVWYYAEGNDNYEETAVSATPIEVTIDKAAITPTVSLDGWTYGSPNDPAVSGNTGNGIVTYYYKTGESEWTTTKPTDAGTHKVKASVAATSNYLAAETDAVEFIISQKALTITAKSQTITYGSAITSTINDVNTDGLVEGDALNSITLSKTKTDYSATAYANDITASGAVIMRSETDVTANYNITYTPGNLTINKAAASVTAAPSGNMGLTYNGSAQQLVNATSATCSGGTLVYCKTSEGTYGEASDITETNAGTYSYYYKVQGDANHSDTDPVEVTNVSIAPKAVTISGITASNKTYDGTTMATLDCSSATFSGIVSGDNLTVTATGTFADANAGTGKTVTISDLTLGGSSVGNYTLAENGNQGSTTADISKAAATVTAPAFSALTYTGSAQNLVSAGSSNHGSFTYSTTQDGTYTNVIPQGTDAGDYTVWYKFTGDGNHNDIAAAEVTGVGISRKAVTVSGITASNKTYDGTTAATLDCSSATFSGLVSGDNLTVTATGTFADANAGTGKTVTISDLTLGGNSVGNYILAATSNQTSTTADIDKASTSVSTNPTAASGLKESSSAQNLLSNGGVASSGGTMYYYKSITNNTPATNASGWTATIPTASAYGTYYVWYYSKGDSNHENSSVGGPMAVSISYRTMSDATAADVGMVICSAGHIHASASTICSGSGVVASGIIAYVGSAGSADQSSSSYKGLAIALNDASYVSSTYGTQYRMPFKTAKLITPDQVCISSVGANDLNNLKNGIQLTNALLTKHTACESAFDNPSQGAIAIHPGPYYARNYSTVRPSGVSEWSLPSGGQWNLIVKGLAAKATESTITTDLQTTAQEVLSISTFNSIITSAGGDAFKSYIYMSSSEGTSASVLWYYNGGNGSFYLTGKGSGPYGGFVAYVRPFFAF